MRKIFSVSLIAFICSSTMSCGDKDKDNVVPVSDKSTKKDKSKSTHKFKPYPYFKFPGNCKDTTNNNPDNPGNEG